MKYGYVYQRSGGPLLSWKNGPPNQTRAAPASLGDTPPLVLPRPGAPEPINDSYRFLKGGGGYVIDTAALGCSSGCGGCGQKSMGGFSVDNVIDAASVPGQRALQIVTGTTYGQGPSLAASAGLAFIAYKIYQHMKRS